MTLSLIGLLIPGLFHWAITEQIQAGTLTQSQESILQQELSLTICIVLFVVYGLHLIFSLRTHKDLFLGWESKGEHVAQSRQGWGKRKSVGILILATLGVILMSEALVGSVEFTVRAWDLPKFLLG